METRDGEGVAVAWQQIGRFLDAMRERGCAETSLKKYLRAQGPKSI